MEEKPRTSRRRNIEPGTARNRSQQVKVSEQDRALIVALARLEGVTPSTWCYQVIMEAVAHQKDRLKNPTLRLVDAPGRARSRDAVSAKPENDREPGRATVGANDEDIRSEA